MEKDCFDCEFFHENLAGEWKPSLFRARRKFDSANLLVEKTVLITIFFVNMRTIFITNASYSS
jgi:hypothetical protein